MRRIVSPAEIRAYDTDTSSTGSCFQPQQDESDDETMSNVGDNEDGEQEIGWGTYLAVFRYKEYIRYLNKWASGWYPLSEKTSHQLRTSHHVRALW